jgi:hypothetical protein
VRNLSSELAYFTLKLGQTWAEDVAQGRALPDGVIAAEVAGSPFGLDAEEAAWLVRELEGSFTTSQARGASVFSDFRPWLREKRAQLDFYYWNRLRRYYLEGGVIQPQVVATLDNVTDELLDFSGNPKDAGIGSRRGMVIGHVQSGKTTNYSALICKAADAGYGTLSQLRPDQAAHDPESGRCAPAAGPRRHRAAGVRAERPQIHAGKDADGRLRVACEGEDRPGG